ncbi:MAG: phosphoadenosine phosphosulfate reductase family protein [Chitinispirillaceae bacterium]|nr:phosphoadenosine phosphosulfate reductase family protein [Chitinispirillaceae bacterium]
MKKRCTHCILSEHFPGVSYDSEGVCSFCRDKSFLQTEENAIQKAQEQVDELLKTVKAQSNTYDAVMLYSGGKDSTYTLYQAVKKYGLKVLSFTLDNGYIPNQTFDNIVKITDKLGVDNLIFRPSKENMKAIVKASALYPIYNKRTMVRISSVCNSCISMVNTQALRIALEKNISIILAGFTLGQIPVNSIIYKNNYTFLEESRAKSNSLLRKYTGEWLDTYYNLPTSLVKNTVEWPTMVNLLCLEKLSEEEIVAAISTLGWTAPKNVDGCSSNCQLNTFNNVIHEKVYGYNPYELELSHMIRKGLIDRETAISKVETMDPELFKSIADDLQISEDEIGNAGSLYKTGK